MLCLVTEWLIGRFLGGDFGGAVVIFLMERFRGGFEFRMVLVVGLDWRLWFLRIGSNFIKVINISNEGKIRGGERL